MSRTRKDSQKDTAEKPAKVDFLKLSLMEKVWAWTNLGYMLRVPILLGVIVFLLPVYARFLARPFLGGLFDFSDAPFASNLWFAFFIFNFAWSIMVASKIILFYGLRRIGTDERTRGWFSERVKPKLISWKVAFYLCLAFGIFCVSGSFWVVTDNLSLPGMWSQQLLGLFCGFVLSLVALLLADAFQSLFYKPGESESLKNFLFPYDLCFLTWLREKDIWKSGRGKQLYNFLHEDKNFVASLINGLKEWFLRQEVMSRGYYKKNNNSMKGASSHITALALFVIFVVVYFLVGYAIDPGSFYIPAIAYIPVLMGGLCWVLANISFFFDCYRIPLVVPLLMWLIFASCGQGHYYKLHEKPMTIVEAKDDLEPPAAKDPDDDYIIVVTADGGGIQASAWTTKVLTGIEEECGPNKRCSEKIRLISSVSGGSVGAMFYLDAFKKGGLPKSKLESIVAQSKSSSLNGVAYGLAYPDFLNSIYPAALIRSDLSDRGRELERAWQRNKQLPPDEQRVCRDADGSKLTGFDCPLTAWKAGVDQGWRPAVVFNGTIVETGERFLVTNSDDLNNDTDNQDGRRSFYKMFRKDAASEATDISIATAARISASYPYVSPVVRPRDGKGFTEDDERKLHVADGGYYDNYGISSAMDWMKLWMAQRIKTGGKKPKIIVVQIVCGDAGFTSPKAKGEGWFLQTLAPLFTLYNVRVAGQRARADYELELFKQTYKDAFEIIPVKFNFTDGMKKMERPGTDPPLSWHLTDKEKEDIDIAWKGSGESIRLLKEAVNPKP